MAIQPFVIIEAFPNGFYICSASIEYFYSENKLS